MISVFLPEKQYHNCDIVLRAINNFIFSGGTYIRYANLTKIGQTAPVCVYKCISIYGTSS